MKRALLIAGIALCAIALSGWYATGHAQQEDPKIAAYRQLLSEANERLAAALGAYNALSAKNAQTEAELAKLNAEKPKADCPNGYTRNKNGSCDPPAPLKKD